MTQPKMELSGPQISQLLDTLQERFEQNMHRHQSLKWASVHGKLMTQSKKLWSLFEMERTGGEPDVVGFDKHSGEYIFMDCSKESPIGRRNLCYDPEALASRKTFKPKDSALALAEVMGVELLTEAQYRELQLIEAFDLKTSSWIITPSEIRKLGGALFADRRYDTVFVYHNGAISYYSARGFRSVLRV